MTYRSNPPVRGKEVKSCTFCTKEKNATERMGKVPLSSNINGDNMLKYR